MHPGRSSRRLPRMIAQLVEAAAVIGELAATNKEAALKELLAAAQSNRSFDAAVGKTLGKRLVDREAIGSTGLGNGVAVPHVKGDSVQKPVLVVARSRHGLEWQSIDGRPVQVFFLLVSPAADPEVHLQALRWIAGLARSADFRRFLLNAADAQAMRELLREHAGQAS